MTQKHFKSFVKTSPDWGLEIRKGRRSWTEQKRVQLHTQPKKCFLFSLTIVNLNQTRRREKLPTTCIEAEEIRRNAGWFSASGSEQTLIFSSFTSPQTFQRHLTSAFSLWVLPLRKKKTLLVPYLSSVKSHFSASVCRPAGPSHNMYSPEHLKRKKKNTAFIGNKSAISKLSATVWMD